MCYYNDPTNSERYIAMAVGFDGRNLIAQLRQHLPEGAAVLELGMGPGTDLDALNRYFAATGTDAAAYFVERYRGLHPNADVFVLDAVTLETERTFDGIYSNKVLYHLRRNELVASFERQFERLNTGGIALHSFWIGNGSEDMHGLHFAYYTEETLLPLVDKRFEVVEIGRYTESETDDSLYLILKKRR